MLLEFSAENEVEVLHQVIDWMEDEGVGCVVSINVSYDTEDEAAVAIVAVDPAPEPVT